MVNINEKDFERFFFYGIKNKKALDLSVIFFSIIEINKKLWYIIKVKQKKDK